ncbi:putative uroporphyrinogen-iii synthase protein [Botrytis fragariae]|uniref:Putative uroporphyrinogen-iii synthase protein n=1 Tax=Botrytis fragariae TaxID=1964551 RepID=A0A8H6AZD3_9HELO|nr:putative uroporphyrinogen-iii synthase protein [Botrytis fragariae]KAF5876379.1 putative uroporphyrinogen-iii synthase protein [Botrytis fragariae]
MATRKATGSVATSSSATTAEKEDTHSESDQRVLEAIRQPSTTTRPSTIVGTAISSTTTSSTSLSATPSATKAEEKEISFKSDPRLLEASSALIARQSEDQDQNQYAGGEDGYMQMQVAGSARNATHIAPEVGNFAGENLLSSSSSSTMMMETAPSNSASISHNDLPSKSRTTMTTILSASISALDIRNCESDSDRSSQAGFVTAGSVPPVQLLSNESDSSTQGGRVARASLGMMLAVFDRPASSEISNTSRRFRPLIGDRIMAFADVYSRTNLRETVSILQGPNEGHSDTEEEENKESSSDTSSEAHDENSEKSETSSSDYDCPRSGTSNRRQRAPQDRQDEKDSGSGGSHDLNPGNGNRDEDREPPGQSNIVTRSAQETNDKSRSTLTKLEADYNIEELQADRWDLNLLGGKGQKKRQRRGVTTSVFFGGGFRSLSLDVAAYASNGKRRKIGEKGEKEKKDVKADDTDDADDEDSDSDMDDEGSVCNVSFYGFKKLLMNWDRLECSRRY